MPGFWATTVSKKNLFVGENVFSLFSQLLIICCLVSRILLNQGFYAGKIISINFNESVAAFLFLDGR